MQARKRRVYPFTAIVGQEEMKLALLLNVIDPRIGGVMIMGDRGTGKSTTIRALADLLPEIDVVAGDPYNSSPSDPDLQSAEVRLRAEHGESLATEKRQVPMVDLPLGATEDRLCGTIDIEKALSEGVRAFEPGLLAKANRGLLYVDEVNLLDDHLVDVLLDSAASGWNTVEREGVSVRHPARFVLIGSGNPEEGELRPQLLDRFGMSVEVLTVATPSCGCRWWISAPRSTTTRTVSTTACRPPRTPCRRGWWRPRTGCRRCRSTTTCAFASAPSAVSWMWTACAATSSPTGQPAPWRRSMAAPRSPKTTWPAWPPAACATACARILLSRSIPATGW